MLRQVVGWCGLCPGESGDGKAVGKMADQKKERMVLDPHQVILRPLVSEKGVHRSTRYRQYAFEVNRLATKDDVRRAVDELFHVKVEKVWTQNRKGKPRRHRFRYGYTKSWKKAIVKLVDGESLDFV